MFQLTLDALSQHRVDIPDIDQQPDLIGLGERFLAYDQSLPPEQQSPVAAHLAALLEACRPHTVEFHHSEAQRTIASENAKRYEDKAYQFLKQIQQILRSTFWERPEEAEAWGFEVKQTTGNILFPGSKKERLRVLNSYITKEESRPAEERFTAPALADIIEVRNQWLAAREVRKSSEAQRTTSRAVRDIAFRRLKEALRLAAATIIVLHHDHAVTLDLKQWGFEMSKRSTRSTAGDAEAKPEGAAETEAAPVNGTNGNLASNGAAEPLVQSSIR